MEAKTLAKITRKRCRLCQHEERDDLEKQLYNMEITVDELDEAMGWPSGTSSKHLRNHMGEYEDKSNPRCVLCTDENRSHYEMQIREGELKPSELAETLGTTTAQIRKHMSSHLQPLVQKSAAQIIARKEVDEIDVLARNVQGLDDKLTQLLQDDDLEDPRYVDSLTKLAREVRESLKYLLEFKGKLVHRREETIIHTQMEIVQEVLIRQHPDVWISIRDEMQKRMA